MDLSIIIVNWNSSDVLKKCLASIKEQVLGIVHEVLVADNNSTDINPEGIRKEYSEVKFFFNKTNMGYSKANNLCGNNAIGEYLLFLNPDIILTSGAVNSMLKFIKDKKEVGAVGGRFLNPDGSLQRFYRKFPKLLYMIFYATILYRIFPENRYAREYQYDDENFETITKVDQA